MSSSRSSAVGSGAAGDCCEQLNCTLCIASRVFNALRRYCTWKKHATSARSVSTADLGLPSFQVFESATSYFSRATREACGLSKDRKLSKETERYANEIALVAFGYIVCSGRNAVGPTEIASGTFAVLKRFAPKTEGRLCVALPRFFHEFEDAIFYGRQCKPMAEHPVFSSEVMVAVVASPVFHFMKNSIEANEPVGPLQSIIRKYTEDKGANSLQSAIAGLNGPVSTNCDGCRFWFLARYATSHEWASGQFSGAPASQQYPPPAGCHENDAATLTPHELALNQKLARDRMVMCFNRIQCQCCQTHWMPFAVYEKEIADKEIGQLVEIYEGIGPEIDQLLLDDRELVLVIDGFYYRQQAKTPTPAPPIPPAAPLEILTSIDNGDPSPMLALPVEVAEDDVTEMEGEEMEYIVL